MTMLRTIHPFMNLIHKIYYVNARVILVAKKNQFTDVIGLLRLHSLCQFQLLVDMVAVDFLTYPYKQWLRFSMVYNLLSVRFMSRIMVFLYVKETDIISTLCYIFFNASWFEREAWDLFGIKFNNPDLRKILTDYGNEGFPFRKDYPMSGFKEMIYSDSLKRTLYQGLGLVQSYKQMFTKSPWLASVLFTNFSDSSVYYFKYFLLFLLFFIIVTPMFQNAIYMCLMLSLSFFFMINSFFYLGLELLPIIILIVYVGAILVVLLFSIFNLNIRTNYMFDKVEFSNNQIILFIILLKLILFLPFYFNEINMPLFRPALAAKAFESEYLIDLYVGIYQHHFIVAALVLLFVSFALTYIIKIKFSKENDGI